MRKLKEEIYCDWCGEKILREDSITEVNIIAKEEICPNCLKRLKLIRDWKNTKKKLVSVNMNDNIELTLGKDGADAWNNRYSKIGIIENHKTGEVINTQFWQFCESMIPAFEKMKGANQAIAFPFEFRILIKDLELKE